MEQKNPPAVMSESAPRFLADRTVGKLAKWLRILGYDTIYLPQLTPTGLLQEGRRQGRVIVTRNTRLLREKNAPSFVFVQSDHFRAQLKQVIDTFHLDTQAAVFTRCIACNQRLETTAKDTVRDRVPEYVWQTQDAFRRCPECHRIYWGATHRDHVVDELRRLGLGKEGLGS